MKQLISRFCSDDILKSQNRVLLVTNTKVILIVGTEQCMSVQPLVSPFNSYIPGQSAAPSVNGHMEASTYNVSFMLLC